MKYSILLILCAVMVAGVNGDDKWPPNYVPGTPEYSGSREGGEDIENAVPIPSLPFTDTGNTCLFLHDYDEVCPYTGSTAPDVVFSYTPCADEVVSIDLCYSSYDTKLFVYENMWTPGAPYACNDDFHFSAPCYTYSSALIDLALAGGNTYYIVIDGYGGDCGVYQIDMTGGGGSSPVESTTWGALKGLFE